MSECPICKSHNCIIKDERNGKDSKEVVCEICGKYQISNTAEVTFSNKGRDLFLSYCIFQHNLHQKKPLVINTLSENTLKEYYTFPLNYKETIIKILEFIKEKEPNGFALCSENYHLFGIDTDVAMKRFITRSEDEAIFRYGLTLNDGGRYLELTAKSIKMLDSNGILSKTVFIAMSFNSELMSVYEQAIKPAIEYFGYKAERIDEVSFNDAIFDNIKEKINQCGFMIADFTDNKHGVYLEAGMGLALDKPVIFTCRDIEIDNIHFDTQHFNYIRWSDIEDFKQKLTERIQNIII